MIAAFAVVLVAGLGILGGIVGHLVKRLDRLEEGNRKLWTYCRKLIDLYYRNRREGAPDPDPLPDID